MYLKGEGKSFSSMQQYQRRKKSRAKHKNICFCSFPIYMTLDEFIKMSFQWPVINHSENSYLQYFLNMNTSAKLEKIEGMGAWHLRAGTRFCKFSCYNMDMRVSLFPLGISQSPSWWDFVSSLSFKLLITVFFCSLCFCKRSISSNQWETHQVVQGICFLSLVYFSTILDSIVLAKNLRAHVHFFLPLYFPPSFPLALFSFFPFLLFPSFFLSATPLFSFFSHCLYRAFQSV